MFRVHENEGTIEINIERSGYLGASSSVRESLMFSAGYSTLLSGWK